MNNLRKEKTRVIFFIVVIFVLFLLLLLFFVIAGKILDKDFEHILQWITTLGILGILVAWLQWKEIR